MIEAMKKKGDTVVNPIYNWTTEDIWEYIKRNKIKQNPLYSCGYERVGCIGCPLASYKGRMKEFSDYPKYKQMYIKAFEQMLKVRIEKGLGSDMEWNNGEDVFLWWIEEYKHNVKGQMSIEDFLQNGE